MQATTSMPVRHRVGRVDALLGRIRGEFLEMPGLRLTGVQAARLLGIDLDPCRRLLDHLVAEGFLSHGSRGHYVRADHR